MHSHSTDMCTVSPMKVAQGAPPTTTYHPMPMVQNSYTKAVENSDLPPPHFNGQLKNYDTWVQKLQQWLGGGDPTYRTAKEERMTLSTLAPWLKGIINTLVAEAIQHTRTAPTLKELRGSLEDSFHEYDPSRANERWRALTPGVVRGQVSLINLEEFYTPWQRLLPFSNKTQPHVIRVQLLSKLPWIKEKVAMANIQCTKPGNKIRLKKESPDRAMANASATIIGHQGTDMGRI